MFSPTSAAADLKGLKKSALLFQMRGLGSGMKSIAHDRAFISLSSSDDSGCQMYLDQRHSYIDARGEVSQRRVLGPSFLTYGTSNTRTLCCMYDHSSQLDKRRHRSQDHQMRSFQPDHDVWVAASR